MTPATRPPARLALLVVCTASLAAIAATAVLWRGIGIDPVATAVLAALTLAGSFLRVDFPFRRRASVEISLAEIALPVGLLLTNPSSVLIGMTFARTLFIVGEAVRNSKSTIKTVFNICQHVCSTAIAVLVAQAVMPTPPGLGLVSAGGVLLAVAAFAASNTVLVSLAISLTSESSLMEALRNVGLSSAIPSVQSVALGVIAAAVWRVQPFLVPVVVAPALLVSSASRQRVEALLDRRRSQVYVRLERDLSRATSSREACRLLEKATGPLLSAEAAVWFEERWLGDVPAGSGPCTVDPTLTVPQVISGPGLGPAVGVPCAAVGLGRAVLVVWRGLFAFSEDDVEALGRLGRSGRLHLDRLAAARELERERATLRAVVDDTFDGITVVGADGRIRMWNRAMAALSGVAAEQAVGEKVHQMLGEGPWGTEGIHDLDRSDDGHVWRVAIASLRDESSDGLHVAVVHDVSEERRTARMKDDMLSIVSHELRTPLTPIKASSQLLRRRWERLAPAQRETLLEQIEHRADHLARLVNDLILVGQLSGDDPTALGVKPIPSDVGQVLADVRTQLELRYPDRELEARCPDALYVTTDPVRLRQILDNLGDNACKFSAPGGRVELTIEADAAHLRIQVVDQGRGIPPADVQRMFGRFERVEDPLVMETSGAGLGLYIVGQLVATLGGEVHLESNPGIGTTVTVELPALTPAPRSGPVLETEVPG